MNTHRIIRLVPKTVLHGQNIALSKSAAILATFILNSSVENIYELADLTPLTAEQFASATVELEAFGVFPDYAEETTG